VLASSFLIGTQAGKPASVAGAGHLRPGLKVPGRAARL